jgi:hypothetical protein
MSTFSCDIARAVSRRSEVVVLESRLPVAERASGLGEPKCAVANAVMKKPLELVLHPGTELPFVPLGPEVLCGTWRAANGKRDQVIFLVMPERLVLEAIVPDALEP